MRLCDCAIGFTFCVQIQIVCVVCCGKVSAVKTWELCEFRFVNGFCLRIVWFWKSGVILPVSFQYCWPWKLRPTKMSHQKPTRTHDLRLFRDQHITSTHAQLLMAAKGKSHTHPPAFDRTRVRNWMRIQNKGGVDTNDGCNGEEKDQSINRVWFLRLHAGVDRFASFDWTIPRGSRRILVTPFGKTPIFADVPCQLLASKKSWRKWVAMAQPLSELDWRYLLTYSLIYKIFASLLSKLPLFLSSTEIHYSYSVIESTLYKQNITKNTIDERFWKLQTELWSYLLHSSA